mmetsp:Transcript_20840/g.49406  ORF Transcript_20840/g.49406 Transcript_20840/m.49406 type:complete len:523 (-) Transcript_20840:4973-6541(-)
MEKAERKERCLKLAGLHASINVLLGELGVGAAEVRLQIRRRLVCHLDAPLQNWLWDKVPELPLHGSRWLGGEEAAEVLVSELLDDLQGTLQILQPSLHQVDVLQHDPVTLTVSNVQLRHGHHILALPHGHVPVVLAQRQALRSLLAHGLHLLHWIRAWRQDEENGRGAGGVLEGVPQNHREGRGAIAVHEVSAVGQDVADPFRHGSAAAVWTQGPKNQQLLEWNGIQALPVQGQFHLLGGNLVEPLLESVWRILLHVLGEILEAFQIVQLQHQAPVLDRQPFRQRILHANGERGTQEVVEVCGIEILRQEAFLEKLESQHGAENQLVPLKQASVHPAEDGHADDGDQPLCPLGNVISWLGSINGLVQEIHEGVQRVLIHVLNEAQLDDQEEEHGSLSRNGTVQLSGSVDLNLRLLGLLHLQGNLLGRGLGLLQALNQGDVVQNGRGIRRGQLRQQVTLKLRQSDLEVVLLAHQLLLLLLQLGLFHVHHHGQDLVLKAIWSDNEVDDGTLGCDLWPVVRVGQL